MGDLDWRAVRQLMALSERLREASISPFSLRAASTGRIRSTPSALKP